MKKLRIGDVYEIATPAPLAYVQFTHEHADMGQLVRVLPGLYQSRPDLAKLAHARELYFVFYTLKYAVRDGEAEVITNAPLPERARPFPMMRRRVRGGWQIANGSKRLTLDEINKMTYVQRLTPEQKKLSLGWELWPHPVMVRELARGWTPELEEEFRIKDTAAYEARKKAEASQGKKDVPSVLDHYLYFPEKTQAEEAAQRLRTKGWQVQVRVGADGENWLALAKQPAPIDEESGDVRDELESLAKELHGEYDGWGTALS